MKAISMKKYLLFLLINIASNIQASLDTKLPFNPERLDKTTQQIVEPSIIVINYSCYKDLDTCVFALKRMNVSTHYMIDIDGSVYETIDGNKNLIDLVNFSDENAIKYLKKRAFHAGHGYFKNARNEIINDMNSHSIGIMFVNQAATPLDSPNVYTNQDSNPTQWYEFSHEQELACAALCNKLKTLYSIADKDIIGHGECAIDPMTKSLGRKVGPGPLFPWENIALLGVGLFHKLSEDELLQPCSITTLELQQELASWGYSVPVNNEEDSATHQAVVQAQIHHDQKNIDGDCRSCRLYYIMKNLHQQHRAKLMMSEKN